MEIHVLTPFSRPHLLNDLLAIYAPQKILWHLLVHDVRPLNYPLPNWVSVHVTGNAPRGWDVMYWKLNEWVRDQRAIVDSDRYGVLCDDDGFDPEYFGKIRTAGDAPVVITQCEIGRKKHDRERKITYMRAVPEQMKPGNVGCQFWIMGNVFRRVVFPNAPSADGQVAAKLVVENEGGVVYLPEASRWYNWLKKD